MAMKPRSPRKRELFCAISIRCSLFTTCEPSPSTSNEISIFAGFPRDYSPCSGHSCSASPRSESTPWFRTRWRTREIGVRLAFGATSGRVVLHIIRENMGVILRGTVIGWALALVISEHATPKNAVNLPIFIGVPAILLGVATLACWIPARRASRIDPMAALRHE